MLQVMKELNKFTKQRKECNKMRIDENMIAQMTEEEQQELI